MSQALMIIVVVVVVAFAATALARIGAGLAKVAIDKLPRNPQATALSDLAATQGNSEGVLKVAESSEHGRKLVEHFYPGFLEKMDAVLKVAGALRNKPGALDVAASTIANLTPTDIERISGRVTGGDDQLLTTKLSDLLR
jgi:hypothetical protein